MNIQESNMQATLPVPKFDLNDITSEPSDEALEALMQRVAEVARAKGLQASQAVLQEIRKTIAQNAADSVRRNA